MNDSDDLQVGQHKITIHSQRRSDDRRLFYARSLTRELMFDIIDQAAMLHPDQEVSS